MKVHRDRVWSCLALVCSLFWGASAYSSDVDALMLIKDALGGSPKTFVSWVPGTDPCNSSVPWVGVQCSKAGRVTSLNLANRTLDGTVSPSIAALTQLTSLVLQYNRLEGQLPNVFGNMTNLKYLDLSRNQFGGPLPSSLGLTNISTLLFFDNNFNQSIPTGLGKMQNLQVANLSSNDFHGGLPASLLSVPSLQVLDISDNYMSGAIPDANFSSTLFYVNVENNTFTGTIPASLAKGAINFLYKGNPGLVLPAPAPAPGLKTPAMTKPAPAPAVGKPASAPAAGSEPASAPTAVNATPALILPPQATPVSTKGSAANGTSSSAAVAAGTGGVPPEGTSNKDSGGSNAGLVVGASIGCAVAVGLIVAGVLALIVVRRKRRMPAFLLPTSTKDSWHGYPDAQAGARPVAGRGFGSAQVFPLAFIEQATHDFAESQQVGTSVGSIVYAAALPHGDPALVALVKRKDPAIAGFQSKSEYEREVAELAKLQHRNLVPFAGCCDDDQERILIFSAPSTTSLRAVLRMASVNDPLDWVARVEIASGIAAALAYLHSKAGTHRLYDELASSSVILDSELRPRLAGFHLQDTGSSADSPNSVRRNFERRTSQDRTSAEHKRTRADVYKFGQILLELITGRPPYSARAPADERNLVSWALPLLSAHDYDALLDERLLSCTEASLSTLTDLAQDCLSELETARPSLAEIQKRIERCQHLHRSGTPNRSPYRSPYVRRHGSDWDEESEYEVRDVPDGPSLSDRSFIVGAPERNTRSPTDSASTRSYHSLS